MRLSAGASPWEGLRPRDLARRAAAGGDDDDVDAPPLPAADLFVHGCAAEMSTFEMSTFEMSTFEMLAQLVAGFQISKP